MARKLKGGGIARDDILSHAAWLAQPGAGASARRKIVAIRDAVRALRTEPITWRRSADHPAYRERPVAGYVIVYRVEPDTDDRRTAGDVLVIRVFGPGQDRASLVSP